MPALLLYGNKDLPPALAVNLSGNSKDEVQRKLAEISHHFAALERASLLRHQVGALNVLVALGSGCVVRLPPLCWRCRGVWVG